MIDDLGAHVLISPILLVPSMSVAVVSLYENERKELYVLDYLRLLLLTSNAEVYVYVSPALPPACAEKVPYFLFRYIITNKKPDRRCKKNLSFFFSFFSSFSLGSRVSEVDSQSRY